MIYISYFYKIRFFKPTMIPVSTAMWDPKWYHENKDQSHVFLDKRGVINGLRYTKFNPHSENDAKSKNHQYCTSCKEVPLDFTDPKYDRCDFLKDYREKLDQYNFDEVINDLKNIRDMVKLKLQLPTEPDIILMVHESPYKVCSERIVLKEYFLDHLINLPELDI